MPKKSIREMGSWELRHYSLQRRVFRATIMGSIVLGIVALVIGLGLYTYSLIQQLVGESFGIARSAEAIMGHVVDVEDISSEVLGIWRGMTESERSQTGTEGYRARFAGVTADKKWRRLRTVLQQFRDSSDVNDIYLGYFDPEKNVLVYFCDPDESEETGFFPGEWERVEQKEIDKFYNWDGEGALYDISKTERYGWMCTSGVPLYDNDGEICGFILADVTLEEVGEGIRRFLIQYTIAMLVVVNLIGYLLSRRMKRMLVDPINSIADAAQNYVNDRLEGDKSTECFSQLDIHTGDEVENLSLVMADMERGLNEYEINLTKVTADKERIATELELARRIQTHMLPDDFPAFPDRSEFDIYALMDPAREVGGDFYDFFLVDDDHLALMIADVSGKGIPAALFMMSARTILSDNAHMGKPPHEVFAVTNYAICANNKDEMFVTAWLGVLEISTGKLTACNAGHEYPALQKAGGAYELLKDKHGFVLGGMDGVEYKDYELQLEPGDKLFVYTDGLPEATGPDNELFGTERMLTALNEDPAADPEETLNNMQDAVLHFVGTEEQFDDLTMLCLEYRSASK
ncbi:MAG: SpoIIE family protein phosphatase [Mogibacterium sp.]|nr:SpoIIE family protein phosphatase [Mogibacterium sp.]